MNTEQRAEKYWKEVQTQLASVADGQVHIEQVERMVKVAYKEGE